MKNKEKELPEEMVNQDLKKEWIKPEMEEVGILNSVGESVDGSFPSS